MPKQKAKDTSEMPMMGMSVTMEKVPEKQKCPVCGQDMNSDHPMLTLDKKKMGKALKKAARKYGGDMTQGMRGR